VLQIDKTASAALKANLEPCLACVWHVTDTGNQRYLQLLSWNDDLECWQDLYNLNPLNNGERILYWTPLKWIDQNYQCWIHEV
jgi:hypothetical protein